MSTCQSNTCIEHASADSDAPGTWHGTPHGSLEFLLKTDKGIEFVGPPQAVVKASQVKHQDTGQAQQPRLLPCHYRTASIILEVCSRCRTE